ncbi:MAG: hypothetical protein KKG14_14665 [Alphaproteobacteria bacterium]|nr:hypothetical protein [Alphaproteobacteria bacterium]MBU2272349.1 hypothetical protein [Alphaproteobacteria bacterium]MBU2419941.1 hypothetical protein [Alphaproteobacteria bacterium]
MKKMIAAVTAGLLLAASQAAAANTDAAARVGDRVGATAGESSEFAGVPLFAILIAAGAIALVVDGVSDDDSDSD